MSRAPRLLGAVLAGGEVIPAAELGVGPAAFLNVNTPDDRVRAEAALEATLPTDAERSAG